MIILHWLKRFVIYLIITGVMLHYIQVGFILSMLICAPVYYFVVMLPAHIREEKEHREMVKKSNEKWIKEYGVCESDDDIFMPLARAIKKENKKK